MNQRLTKTQMEWYKTANDQERKRFMANGEAGIIEMQTGDFNEVAYAPTVRGVRIGEIKDSAAEALTLAKAKLGSIQALAAVQSVNLNEHDLGISGENQKIAKIAESSRLKMERLFHLGSTIPLNDDGLPSDLYSILTSVMGLNLISLEDQLPITLFDLDESTGELPDDGQRRFIERCHRDGIYGFLAEISAPSPVWFHCDSVQYADSEDYRQSWFFYDENLPRVWAQATAWQTAMIERRRNDALK